MPMYFVQGNTQVLCILGQEILWVYFTPSSLRGTMMISADGWHSDGYGPPKAHLMTMLGGRAVQTHMHLPISHHCSVQSVDMGIYNLS